MIYTSLVIIQRIKMWITTQSGQGWWSNIKHNILLTPKKYYLVQ